MANVRKIKKVLRSRATLEGAGVRLKRSFGNEHIQQLDPFLLLDEFRSDNRDDYIRGFPWHPHRGIETITYVIRGRVEHGDSMGNAGIISSGDVQWMTAGSGIIHQEMPEGDEKGGLWGLQLWANLPASHKMMQPRYRDVKSGQIPSVDLHNGVTVRVVAGEVAGKKGPVEDVVIAPEYLDITLPPGETYSHSTETGHTACAYVLEGSGYFEKDRNRIGYKTEGASYFDIDEDCNIGRENLILYGDGDSVEIEAGVNGVRLLLLSGKPLNEPVAWYGPIVMNTREELETAFEEYQAGTFIK
jgi:quercetin 2,3-dioxygenase